MAEPTGVVIHDADKDLLIPLPALLVQHEGRTRELSLRVARGTIRDVPAGREMPA